MQLVIDISETLKGIADDEDIKTFSHIMWQAILMDAIKNGTPLPKGHGDLIDKDRLLDELEKTVKSVDDTNKHLLFWDRAVAHVHLSKPIIEADGGKEDENSD